MGLRYLLSSIHFFHLSSIYLLVNFQSSTKVKENQGSSLESYCSQISKEIIKSKYNFSRSILLEENTS